MPSRALTKTYFETFDFPTQVQFYELFDQITFFEDYADSQSTMIANVAGIPINLAFDENTVLGRGSGDLGAITFEDLAAGLEEFIGAVAADITVNYAMVGNFAATYTNLGGVGDTLTATSHGALTSQGLYTPQVGHQVLLFQQSDKLRNGVWDIINLGSPSTSAILTRSTDADSASELDQLVVFVISGTFSSKYYTQQTELPTPGSSKIIFKKGLGGGQQSVVMPPNLILFGTGEGIDGSLDLQWDDTGKVFNLINATDVGIESDLITLLAPIVAIGDLVNFNFIADTLANNFSFYLFNGLLGTTEAVQISNNGLDLFAYDQSLVVHPFPLNFHDITNSKRFSITVADAVDNDTTLLLPDGTPVPGDSIRVVTNIDNVLTTAWGSPIIPIQRTVLQMRALAGGIVPSFPIIGADNGAKTFNVTGDQTGVFITGLTFTISGSTANDSIYTVVSSSFGSDTAIIVLEGFPSNIADGNIDTNSQLVPGQLYQITDAYSGAAVINIKAFSTSVLEQDGWGSFQNAAMSASVYCQMWYDLTSDVVEKAYDPILQNTISVDAVSKFPFDNSVYTGNTIESSNFTLSTNGVGSFLVGCYFKANSIVNLDIHGKDTQLTNCVIGAGKTFDLSILVNGYVQEDKVLEGDLSTFEITSSDSTAVNPDGSDTIDMSPFQFAGILRPDQDGKHLDTFNHFPTDHKWYIYPTSAATDFEVTTVDNIKLNTLLDSGSTRKIDGSAGDHIGFEVNSGNAGDVSEIAVAIYH